MVGMGENFLCAFLLALGVGDVGAGLVSVIPILIGSLLQLHSSYGLKYFSSYKKWVVACVLIQAFSFVPLIVISFQGRAPLWLVFFFISLYWGSGMAASTSWNVWIANLVSDNMKKSFFSNRGLFSQIFSIIGLVIGGALLEWGEGHGHKMGIFSFLFMMAFILRLFSAFHLSQQSELKLDNQFSPKLGFYEFFREIFYGKASSLLKFMLLFYLCIHISSPFFSPFMLSKLNLSYSSYMLLIACVYITKSLAYHLLGTTFRRLPNHLLLFIGALGITVLPWLWTLSTHYLNLCLFQMASGFVWAIFELATLLLTMELIPDDKRSKILSFYNVFNYSGMLIGALLGGYYLSSHGNTFHAFLDLFSISTLIRLMALILLPGFYYSYQRQVKEMALN
jgi:predicted MFS family arabinose efflux permease